MFVDPWGLDDYIFYGMDQEKYAHSLYNTLTSNGIMAHEFYIKHPEDFYDSWASMGIDENGNTISIDNVYIHLHGEPHNILSSAGGLIYSSNLEHKTINTLIMSCCNTGNLDFENNFAIQLMKTQNIHRVFAPDGLGSLFVENYVYSIYDPSYSNVDREGKGYIMYENAYSHIKIIPYISNNMEYVRILDLNKIGDSIPGNLFTGKKLCESRIYKIPFRVPKEENFYFWRNEF